MEPLPFFKCLPAAACLSLGLSLDPDCPLGCVHLQVAPGGLLDRVFREMGVGLKKPCLHMAAAAAAVPRCLFAPHTHCDWTSWCGCLQLPATKWKGLKLLPTAAPSASDETFRQMVRPGDACGVAGVWHMAGDRPQLALCVARLQGATDIANRAWCHRLLPCPAAGGA